MSRRLSIFDTAQILIVTGGLIGVGEMPVLRRAQGRPARSATAPH